MKKSFYQYLMGVLFAVAVFFDLEKANDSTWRCWIMKNLHTSILWVQDKICPFL